MESDYVGVATLGTVQKLKEFSWFYWTEPQREECGGEITVKC